MARTDRRMLKDGFLVLLLAGLALVLVGCGMAFASPTAMSTWLVGGSAVIGAIAATMMPTVVATATMVYENRRRRIKARKRQRERDNLPLPGPESSEAEWLGFLGAYTQNDEAECLEYRRTLLGEWDDQAALDRWEAEGGALGPED